jgi:hypothetical protein
MANLTREQILARKTGRGKATLPDGSTVEIRALTRNEVLEAGEGTKSTAERDNLIISMGMTDPVLTVADVEAWAAEAGAGDLVAVSDAIGELSGLKEGAGKSRVSASRRRS